MSRRGTNLPYRRCTIGRYLATMPIYTRTGDDGETSLFGGGRVPKDDMRVLAYGDVDETNAAIGYATSVDPRNFEDALLDGIQRDLFAIGGQLAAPNPDKVARALVKAQLDADRVTVLEEAIDRFDEELPELSAFVLPGGSPKAAAFHVARTVCRRAERSVTSLAKSDTVPPIVLVYLNRLSDLLFTLARLANHRAGVKDRSW